MSAGSSGVSRLIIIVTAVSRHAMTALMVTARSMRSPVR